ACDRDARFPEEFYAAMAAAGWLGIAMPPELGGAGLGVTEAALLMHAVARAGGMTAASAIHINIFGPHAIVVYGREEQRRAWLPDIIQGRVKCCFGVTEPNAGLETGAIETRAERRPGGGYVVNGRKLWTSTAQRAQKIMLLARTTPRDQCRRSTDGLTLFYTDLDRARIEVREIAKMGRAAVDTNALFIDGLVVPDEHRIGAEGQGFACLLHSLNPERVLIGAEGIGIGRSALDRAARYARERVVFGRPIGQNQAIQHPLAELWVELEAAWLTTLRAAWLYDQGRPCGPEANAAKYLGGEVGWKACSQAMLTLGGMGYAKEFHVERLLREVMIVRLAPVSPQLILCNIAEKVLELPKSY
ncbi:MAG: acyl-CoA/acyl-ACP dehydrogenase, partial [Alphaproteobacteria bacterium]|nr:acyl-CoA/acyl-ACP dehydrogenase [Alphaproteobacteria bacterium]